MGCPLKGYIPSSTGLGKKEAKPVRTRRSVRTIRVGDREFLHPSEMPGYDPKTGTYRGGVGTTYEENQRDLDRYLERKRRSLENGNH